MSRDLSSRLAALERRVTGGTATQVIECCGGLSAEPWYASGGAACPDLALARGDAEPLADFRTRAVAEAQRIRAPLLVLSSFPG